MLIWDTLAAPSLYYDASTLMTALNLIFDALYNMPYKSILPCLHVCLFLSPA